MNAGRNDPCPCGSGKKYKKCCLGKFEPSLPSSPRQQRSEIVAPNGGAKSAPSPAELNQLVALFKAGYHAELENQARMLLERYPDTGFVWKVLGVMLQVQGRDSLSALRKAAEHLPGDHEVHYNLGNTLLSLNCLAEAEASYRKALRLMPDDADVCFNLGNALWKQGRLDEAAAAYLKTLRIRADHAEAHCNLGNILQELGRLDEAEASYRRALQIKSGYAAAHYNLGNLLHGRNRLDEAEASFRKALQVMPNHAEAHSNLGKLLLDRGRLDEAEACFQRALQIRPDYLIVRLSLALAKKAKAGDENLAALIAAEQAARHRCRLKRPYFCILRWVKAMTISAITRKPFRISLKATN